MDLLSWILGLIIGSIVWPLVQGIAGNLLTDPVKNWFDSRTYKSKRRQIGTLRKELDEITKLHRDREMRYLELFHNLFAHGLFGTIGIVLVVFALIINIDFVRQVFLIAAVGMFSIIIRGFFDSMIMVARIKNFDEYKQRTEERIDGLSKKMTSSQNQITG